MEWRQIPYLPEYSASSEGAIRRDVQVYNRAPGTLRQSLLQNGYAVVNIRSKNRLVHRLVAAAFYGDSPLHVRHIDGQKTNNSSVNLTYGTAKENAQDKRAHGTYLHTHCRRGHRLTEENSAWARSARGVTRRCRTCKTNWDQARRLRQKENTNGPTAA